LLLNLGGFFASLPLLTALFWQPSGIISFIILIYNYFMVLISRPIKQINMGVGRLADKNFNYIY